MEINYNGVKIEGRPVRVQMGYELEPVGEEWDGTIRPISQLSYRAPDGSIRATPRLSLDEARELAGKAAGPYRCPACGEPVDEPDFCVKCCPERTPGVPIADSMIPFAPLVFPGVIVGTGAGGEPVKRWPALLFLAILLFCAIFQLSKAATP